MNARGSQPHDLERERANACHGRGHSIALRGTVGREDHLGVSARPGDRGGRRQRPSGCGPRDRDARHSVAGFVGDFRGEQRATPGDDRD